MKSYLCREKDKEVVPIQMTGEKTTSRPAMYFVLKAPHRKTANKKVKKMGAEVVRELTEKEVESEGEDGSYAIDGTQPDGTIKL